MSNMFLLLSAIVCITDARLKRAFFVCGLDPHLGLFPTSTVENHDRGGLVNTQFGGVQRILLKLP